MARNGGMTWRRRAEKLDGFDLSPSDSEEVHVLAVDDSLVDRKVIERLLRISSCKVTAVDSGIRALQFLGLDEEKNNNGFDGLKVDLIITDYCMPGMTGYELLKKIKESSAFREIPVVIMSSENILTRIDRCLEEGAEDFIVKPVKLSDVKRIKDYMSKDMRVGTEGEKGRGGINKRKQRESCDCFLLGNPSSFMAVNKFQNSIFLSLVGLVFFITIFPCSQASPQNIEVFYPTQTPVPPPLPEDPLPTPERLPPEPQPPPRTPPSPSSDNTNKTIAKAVAATAASTIVIAGIFFFCIRKYVMGQRKKDRVGDSFQGGQPPPRVVAPPDEFARVNGNVKGLIVDENGLDVLYWRQLQDGENKNGFRKEFLHSPKDEEEGRGGGMIRKGSRSQSKKVEPVQEIPLLRGKSSTSHVPPPPEDDDSTETISPKLPPPPSHRVVLNAVEKREAPLQSKFLPPSSMPPPQPPIPPPSLPIQHNNSKSPAAPPPPPPPAPSNRTPPPPPPPVPAKGPAPPPPPAPAKGPAPPPPPPKAGGSVATSLKPPPPKSGESSSGNNQVKLKPLHWDKVNNNVEHSMVWDKIHGGSFKVDDDLMEALFGYVATNRKSPNGKAKNTGNTSPGSSSQIMVLDARKSQNIAIVLKSLALSRRELVEALNEGQGLEAETIEKLMRIAPTEEEQSQILDFDGDPTKLADAESFLFHILKAIPSAFTRLNAMQFRTNYDSEILHIRENLQNLELGCKELRSQRLFMKLLEAILKAGNRMNAGTARGNAQAFNLTSLLKLSDVKSTDGKTTLLHFVVEEVVRSEGKKCYIKDREKEYTTLGLPVVGGLSADFTNVKKAATIDFSTFSSSCSALSARVAEIKRLVSQCLADGKGGFVKEMKGFIDDAEEELKAIAEEQKRVMDNVKRTAEYYQAGASKDPFQIFVIVRDFLGMVDQVCVEIARNQQRRKSPQSPNSSESRTKMRFPVLPPNFMTGKSRSNSSESDGDS
ncbi:hypothetical protein COLO4_36281 [Corchorus olitorius]|uniref:Formin-like protein n=1 Tax=Corchorus olitorius TaxID=93759 RepID=A0A1R3GA86_9ROSI|nr:hypothetical protein COLO4_36281 [Corchorus olitorius]